MNSHPELAGALAGWLPTRRWFGGGGQRVDRVVPVRVVELDGHREGGPRGLLVVAAVQLSGAAGDEVRHYQIPLGVRPGAPPPELVPDLVAQLDGHAVYDATGDPELMTVLLKLVAESRLEGAVRFTAEVPEALTLARRAGLPARRGRPEQSNTSVVFGDRFILKLFRRLAVGVNPDLEVHRRVRSPHLARLLGSIEGVLDGAPVTLGIVQAFAPGAVDGWDLVTSTLPGALRACSGGHLLPALRELGGALAAVHTRLAEAFGTAELSVAWAEAVRKRMHDRLTAAAREAPALRPYLDPLRGAIEDAGRPPPGERVQRVHGDLHLGQVLRTGDGWMLIDFEGEPATPIGERVAWRSPLQDVAGMLRSLEYAASQLLLSEPDLAAPAEAWVAAAREAFCRGYAEAAGTTLAGRSALLLGYELDKAVYEVAYETRNRPDWLPIPLRAIRRYAAELLGKSQSFR